MVTRAESIAEAQKVDYLPIFTAEQQAARISLDWERHRDQVLCPIPNEEISTNELRRISVPLYGMSIRVAKTVLRGAGKLRVTIGLYDRL